MLLTRSQHRPRRMLFPLSHPARPAICRTTALYRPIPRPLRGLHASTPRSANSPVVLPRHNAKVKPARGPAATKRTAPSPKPIVLPKVPYARARSIQQALMQKLVDSGQTLLYRAPSHTGILLASFLGFGGMIFGALVTFDNKQWRRQPGLPWWSTVANITGIMAMGALSAFCYWRGARLISSISVTTRTVDEAPVLLVKVRRYVPLPFVPPRK